MVWQADRVLGDDDVRAGPVREQSQDFDWMLTHEEDGGWGSRQKGTRRPRKVGCEDIEEGKL